jgi:photosynthetic reaction center cytochrome c subunit
MTAMNIWVSPAVGCAYCHAPTRDKDGNVVKDERGIPIADPNKMDSDELYTKIVARRMLQMTMRINGDWQQHVKQTGVTCWTCHRGNPVPLNIWYDAPLAESTRFQGLPNPPRYAPAALAGLTSLPVGVLRPYLAGDTEIRVQDGVANTGENGASIKQAEWSYALMFHMSSALGVNCTYCHNSRAFRDWSQSPPPRTTAWYGVRMVRELNAQFLEPLKPTIPHARLGPLGDAPKANCTTCHQGAYKPLLGVSMLKDYQELAAAKPQPVRKVVETPPPANPPAADAAAEAAGVKPEGTPQDAKPVQPEASPAEPTPSQPTTVPETKPAQQPTTVPETK